MRDADHCALRTSGRQRPIPTAGKEANFGLSAFLTMSGNSNCSQQGDADDTDCDLDPDCVGDFDEHDVGADREESTATAGRT